MIGLLPRRNGHRNSILGAFFSSFFANPQVKMILILNLPLIIMSPLLRGYVHAVEDGHGQKLLVLLDPRRPEVSTE